jgi:ATP-dependent exoDNAse (exonuclease V) beta subunit
MTRARDRLIVSGGLDRERMPEPRPGGPPIDWVARALAGADACRVSTRDAYFSDTQVVEREWDGRRARVRLYVCEPETEDVAALVPTGRRRIGAPATALPAAPKVMPAPPVRPRPAPQRLSYSALQAYAKCPYRFYLQRVLGLPPEPVPPPPEEAEAPAAQAGGLDPRVRGSLVHILLEKVDFARPEPPSPEEVAELAAAHGVETAEADVEDIRALVAAFGASPLCGRLAAARRVRREAGFAFALEPSGGGSLVTGFVDAIATEAPGARLIVDYKSDRLGEAGPAEVVDRDYATQRAVYALAALRDGAEQVDVAYCFLERPADPVVRRYAAADAAALAEEVLRLARGVLDERYPVTDAPHRELCADCPGRKALCSHPESRTLAPAEPPQASAGSLAGSGGPS